jgi:hypothetical protein
MPTGQLCPGANVSGVILAVPRGWLITEEWVFLGGNLRPHALQLPHICDGKNGLTEHKQQLRLGLTSLANSVVLSGFQSQE